MSDSLIFVSGASGNMGRRTVELLLEAGAAGRIVAGTRTPDTLNDLRDQGVIVRYADFDDRESLVSAFEGVERFLLISTVANNRAEQHTTAIDAAKAAGVKHIVYTSIVNATDTPVVLAVDHAATEAALKESGLSYTVLRNNIYMEVAADAVKQALQLGGTLSNAAGEGRHAYISREDCARAAVADLLSAFEGQRILDITGGESLSQEDIAKIASNVTGTPITYAPISLDQLRENLAGAGFPPPVIEIIATFDAGAAADKFELVSGDFKALTGQEPRRAADVLAELLQQ